ncbi:MAG: carbamoyltransferase N-terminal domain-containing protein, partial [bacterium]
MLAGVHDGHDAGAALVRDGKVLAALQEERLRNVKHYSGTPEYAIREVFRIAEVDPSEVDAIAIAGLVRVHAPLKERPLKVKLFEKLSPLLAGHTFAKLYVKLLHKFRNMEELKKIFENLGLAEKEVMFVEHHLSHASCAYRSCPWGYDEPVLVFTADGAGDGISSTVSVG